MEVLKIATAGSVDDGKSTLIGRILYDTQSLPRDKLDAIARSSKQKGLEYLDFSLATDGLVAEREQGITIDVAHIYFSTATRSYIIADTPGHIEYTRNMITGASSSQVSIILIDARKGVIEQTYRHFFINNLLRIRNIIVAVNKMDLVDYSQHKFDEIQRCIETLASKSDYQDQRINCIPISALHGQNVACKSQHTPWYAGETLLGYLHHLRVDDDNESEQMRFPIQTTIRPKTAEFHDYRAYAGKLYGNSLKVGERVTVLPSKTSSRVKQIYFYDKQYQQAQQGSSINITLEDDINISRGDLLVKSSEIPEERKTIEAKICWMDRADLIVGKKYTIQQATRRITAKIQQIHKIIKPDLNGEILGSDTMTTNEIGEVRLELAKPLFYDSYADNKANGCFIIIDRQTHNTSGVGFIH